MRVYTIIRIIPIRYSQSVVREKKGKYVDLSRVIRSISNDSLDGFLKLNFYTGISLFLKRKEF